MKNSKRTEIVEFYYLLLNTLSVGGISCFYLQYFRGAFACLDTTGLNTACLGV